jgi:general secretion pathway protein K
VSPLSLPTFFAAAKKVGAAPHRGEANRPKAKQGKANTTSKQPKTNPTRPTGMQGKANTVGTTINAAGKTD